VTSTTSTKVMPSVMAISSIVAVTKRVVSNTMAYCRSCGKRADRRSSSPRTALLTESALASGA
jgi:hypothetical protein